MNQAEYFNDMDREFHRTFDRHMNDLFLAIKTGNQPPIHAIAGQRALLLAHAERLSLEKG